MWRLLVSCTVLALTACQVRTDDMDVCSAGGSYVNDTHRGAYTVPEDSEPVLAGNLLKISVLHTGCEQRNFSLQFKEQAQLGVNGVHLLYPRVYAYMQKNMCASMRVDVCPDI